MDEEYPDQEGQETYAERAGARASPDGDPQPPAGGPSGDSAPPPAPELPSAGDDRVDEAVAGLRRLRALPVDERVAVLEEVHGRLRDILAELDQDTERPGAASGRP